MYKPLLVWVIIMTSILAFVFSPWTQGLVPTRDWVERVALSPFGWMVSIMFVLMALGAFITLLSPNRSR